MKNLFLFISLFMFCSCASKTYYNQSLDVITFNGTQHFDNVIVQIKPNSSNSLQIFILESQPANFGKFHFSQNGVYYKYSDIDFYLGNNYRAAISNLYKLKDQNIINDDTITEFDRMFFELKTQMRSERTHHHHGIVGRNIF